jgi:hypothetical protein
MNMNANEIGRYVSNSVSHITTDVMTNRERTAYICAVFEVDAFRLDDHYNYDDAITTGHPGLIYAALQLASLQFEYATRMHLEKLTPDDVYEKTLHYLEKAKSRLRWALAFRRFDLDIAVYPFAG